MRLMIAGATGAVGSRLVRRLVAAGHDVVGTTSRQAGCGTIAALGGSGVVMDPLSSASVHAAVARARPEVIVHELTALAGMSGNPKKFDRDFAMTNRLRTEGTDHLLAAATAHGVRRFVAQSFGGGWTCQRSGGPAKSEDDPLVADPGKEARESYRAILHLERAVTTAPGIEGLALRYGYLYGPGNSASRQGDMGVLIRKGRFPVVGAGTGVWSFVHIDDAAAATAAAVERGDPGVYNIVDDEPAAVGTWLPYFAEQLGGKKPMRLPAWLARPLVGEFGLALMTSARGSSNAKAKRELGWEPAFASWREGFRTGIG